jgi:hypothetical protein
MHLLDVRRSSRRRPQPNPAPARKADLGSARPRTQLTLRVLLFPGLPNARISMPPSPCARAPESIIASDQGLPSKEGGRCSALPASTRIEQDENSASTAAQGSSSAVPRAARAPRQGEQFCGECGEQLAGRSTPAAPPDPRSYTPKHRADKILQSKGAQTSHRALCRREGGARASDYLRVSRHD